jgi:HK97 family phage major capsid protein
MHAKHSRREAVSLLPTLRARRIFIAFGAIMFAGLVVMAFLYSPKLAICALAALPFLGLVADTDADFRKEVLDGIVAQRKGLGEVDASFRLLKDDTTKSLKELREEANEMRSKMVAVEKHQLGLRNYRPARPGQVSEDCARFMGALAIARMVAAGKAPEGSADRAMGFAEEVLGKEYIRTVISASDFPLPAAYGQDIIELVSQWGAARQYGTVYPLGASVSYLPRLKTDTTFTLLTPGTAITEKSPQYEWVTFTAEKFGGMIFLPSEIEEDAVASVGQFISRYMARNIARVEDWQFFQSTGAASGVNGTAKGLAGPATSSLVAIAGKTAASGTLGSPSEFTLAHLRSIRRIVDAPVLGRAAYYAHPTMEAQFASFNSAGDKPYMANGIQGASLDGYPIRWVDSLPPLIAGDLLNTVHILFGDVSYMYLGVRGGPRIDTSREAGFTTDSLYIRGLERLTVGYMATGAVSGLITHTA